MAISEQRAPQLLETGDWLSDLEVRDALYEVLSLPVQTTEEAHKVFNTIKEAVDASEAHKIRIAFS